VSEPNDDHGDQKDEGEDDGHQSLPPAESKTRRSEEDHAFFAVDGVGFTPPPPSFRYHNSLPFLSQSLSIMCATSRDESLSIMCVTSTDESLSTMCVTRREESRSIVRATGRDESLSTIPCV